MGRSGKSSGKSNLAQVAVGVGGGYNFKRVGSGGGGLPGGGGGGGGGGGFVILGFLSVV